MSPLQQRMLEDMQLRGLSARTQEAYARAVWQLAQHYHRSPEQLGDEELRQYFVPVCCCTFRARTSRTVTCRYWCQRCNCCVPTGARIAHHSGCFQHQRGMGWPTVSSTM